MDFRMDSWIPNGFVDSECELQLEIRERLCEPLGSLGRPQLAGLALSR